MGGGIGWFTGHVGDFDVDCAEALGDGLAEGGFCY